MIQYLSLRYCADSEVSTCEVLKRSVDLNAFIPERFVELILGEFLFVFSVSIYDNFMQLVNIHNENSSSVAIIQLLMIIPNQVAPNWTH